MISATNVTKTQAAIGRITAQGQVKMFHVPSSSNVQFISTLEQRLTLQ